MIACYGGGERCFRLGVVQDGVFEMGLLFCLEVVAEQVVFVYERVRLTFGAIETF